MQATPTVRAGTRVSEEGPPADATSLSGDAGKRSENTDRASLSMGGAHPQGSATDRAGGTNRSGPATSFTAHIVSQTRGRPTVEGNVYVSDGRMRIDFVSDGLPRVLIVRPDLDRLFVLTTSTRSYVVKALADANEFNAYRKSARGRKEGVESVGAKICDRWSVQSGSRTYRFWLEAGTDVPVRMETADGATHVEYDHVVVGSVPESVFEVPADYIQLDR